MPQRIQIAALTLILLLEMKSDLLKNLQEILTGLDLELLQNSEQQKS